MRWKVNKTKSPREIKFTPFVEANGMRTYGAPYKVKLDYMEELNSYNHVYERKWGKGWYTSGYDDEKNYINLVDVYDMSDENLASRIIDESDSEVITFVIDGDVDDEK